MAYPGVFEDRSTVSNPGTVSISFINMIALALYSRHPLENYGLHVQVDLKDKFRNMERHQSV
jgi:hypothetical protein